MTFICESGKRIDKFRSITITLFLLISLFINQSILGQKGLQVEYYDGTNFERLVKVQTESKIDKYWNDIPPVAGIDPHECSIRWTGKIRPGATGTYAFSARVDDGIRVWIDDQLIIDDWHLNDVGRFNGRVEMKADTDYDLKVEYFNALIEGEITLLWKVPPPEKKWYHRWLGGEFEVIESEYFYQPNEVFTTPVVKVVQKEEEHIPSAKPTVEKKVERVLSQPESVSSPVQEVVDVEPEIIEVEPQPLNVREYIPKNIEFERAKTTILEASFGELNHFAQFMLDHPHYIVAIEGHTDPVGNAEKNLELSERRAYAVARYLVKKGVEAKRISAKGLGGTKPLKIPEDGKYHPANRRVEFIVSEDGLAISAN